MAGHGERTLVKTKEYVAAASSLVVIFVVGAVAYGNWTTNVRALALAEPEEASPVAFAPPTSPATGLRAARLDDAQSAIVALAASVRPAVVSVSRRGQGGHVSPRAGSLFLDPYVDGDVRVGSGTVVDPRGLVLTSMQVAGTATDFVISWPGPPEINRRALRVANDPSSDLVLLQVQGGESFPALALADSDRVKIGDIVLAFGTPFGFGSTTTLGIVGSNRRKVNLEGREFQDLIQVDARLNPGDSGGPLVNIAGELVGVNIGALAMNSTFVGIAFAVASNGARRLLAGL